MRLTKTRCVAGASHANWSVDEYMRDFAGHMETAVRKLGIGSWATSPQVSRLRTMADHEIGQRNAVALEYAHEVDTFADRKPSTRRRTAMPDYG